MSIRSLLATHWIWKSIWCVFSYFCYCKINITFIHRCTEALVFVALHFIHHGNGRCIWILFANEHICPNRSVFDHFCLFPSLALLTYNETARMFCASVVDTCQLAKCQNENESNEHSKCSRWRFTSSTCNRELMFTCRTCSQCTHTHMQIRIHTCIVLLSFPLHVVRSA